MRARVVPALWVGYLVVSLLLLDVLGSPAYPIVVVLAGLALAVVTARLEPRELVAWRPVAHDIGRVIGLYVACVGLFYLAFQVFGMGNVAGLFFAFAAGLLSGVGGPVLHVVVAQRRPLSALGLTQDRLVETLALGLLLAGVQGRAHLPEAGVRPARHVAPAACYVDRGGLLRGDVLPLLRDRRRRAHVRYRASCGRQRGTRAYQLRSAPLVMPSPA